MPAYVNGMLVDAWGRPLSQEEQAKFFESRGLTPPTLEPEPEPEPAPTPTPTPEPAPTPAPESVKRGPLPKTR